MSLSIGFSGTNGWLAKHVINKLESELINIIDFDNLTRKLSNRPNKDAIKKLDWFFHFASKTNIENSIHDPFDTYKNNLNSTLSAIEIAQISKANLLYLSSYVYGDPEYQPIDEHHIVRPKNPYMNSKWISEQICYGICKQLNIPLTIFRVFNGYGSGQKKGRIISDLLDNAFNNKDLQLNDPVPIRDYLYVEDFNNLLLKMLYSKKSTEGTYNIGSGESLTNMEVAKIINKIVNPLLKIRILSNPRKNDISVCKVNNRKVSDHFDWNPSYNLEKGIKHIIDMRKAD